MHSTAHVAAYYNHLAAQASYKFGRWNFLERASRYALAANPRRWK